jgi:hypothetical protein
VIATRDVPARAVSIGQWRVIPVEREWSLHWPGGGLVWVRPYAAVVETGGSSTCLRIRDRTRRIQLGVLGAGLAAALLIRWSLRPRNSRGEQ